MCPQKALRSMQVLITLYHDYQFGYKHITIDKLCDKRWEHIFEAKTYDNKKTEV